MKPNVKAGTMLGSPNSLSLRQAEPLLTSQSPGEQAELPAAPQEAQAEEDRLEQPREYQSAARKSPQSVIRKKA